MPTINQLPAIDVISSGDQLPVYAPNLGDVRRMSISTLAQYIEDNVIVPNNAANVTYDPAGGGAVSRSVQAKLRDVVSLLDFGADPTGVISCNAALSAAKTYLDSLTVTPDAAGPTVRGKLIIPPGTFLLTANAELPLEVECQGRFTGAYSLTLTNVKRPVIKGLSCSTLKLSGVWFGIFEDIYGTIEIDGGGVGFGTFWNTFIRCNANVTIDLSNWSVNQNTFNGRGGFVTVGTSGSLLDGHGNNTVDWDFTGGQCSNTSTLQQDSVLNMVYYEAGADITGPYHIWGFQGDADGPPKVNRRNHILGSYDVVEKNRADFLATSQNILAGGNWADLDSSGKPPCITVNNGPSTVVNESSEPFGLGVKIGGAFTTAFSNFTITLPPCSTGKFSLVVAYQGDDFASIEVIRTGGTSSFGGGSISWADQSENWKLLRVSGNASKTNTTLVRLYALTSAGSKTIHLGGMYATQEKAAQLPSKPYIREAHGTVTQGYVTGASSVAVAITFPRAFASAPTVITSVGDNGAQTANYTKVVIESLTASGFTARVYYSTEWTGHIHWFARGIN